MDSKKVQDVPVMYLSKYEFIWKLLFLDAPETIYQVFVKTKEKWDVYYLKDCPSNFPKNDKNINITKRLVSWVADQMGGEIKIAVLPFCILSYIDYNDGHCYTITRVGEGLNTHYIVEQKSKKHLSEDQKKVYDEYKTRIPSLVDGLVSENTIPITEDTFQPIRSRCEILEID